MQDNTELVHDFIEVSGTRVTLQEIIEFTDLDEQQVKEAFKDLKSQKKLITYRSAKTGVTFAVQQGLDRSPSRK